jgi:hypothetical protein
MQLLSTLSSEAAAVFSPARAAVVEALWWLIHSTGCFGATLPAEDVRQLLGGDRREQLLLPCLDSCPTSVVRTIDRHACLSIVCADYSMETRARSTVVHVAHSVDL